VNYKSLKENSIMTTQFKAGNVRRTLAENQAKWKVIEQLNDEDPAPIHGLGGSVEGLKQAGEVGLLDWRSILTIQTNNPFLVERRTALDLGSILSLQTGNPLLTGHRVLEFLPAALVKELTSLIEGELALKAVDWRDRWGWPWITTVQDQDGCESCWAFAATALVESMTRIEHAVWSKRSEGDVHHGMGAKCANTGGATSALDWIKTNGIADPDCYPWSTNDPPYITTLDRSGRTVKIADYTLIGDINQQKTWLDTVGPLATFFEVWHDFDFYGGGIYTKQDMINGEPNYDRGGHFMLVIGYDDDAGCWIVKNSWGAFWGEEWMGFGRDERGYARIAYGQTDIDTYAKIGLQYTNPDPWTKHRLHNGNMIESGNGSLHRNLEMLATTNGSQIQHWWREGSDLSWHQASIFGNDAAVCPTLIASTYNRNFETVYLTTSNQLHHWYFDQVQGQWIDGGVFGPTDAYGVPAIIQSNYDAPGNFEVVVRTSDGKLNYWWRENAPLWHWHDIGRFGSNVAFSGATLVQSHYGQQGNFELVCVLESGEMQHFWRDNDNGMAWNAGDTFGSGVFSTPCMIEGQFGASDEKHVGNFELCVAVDGAVQHWWRDNQNNTGWQYGATFGHDVQAVTALVESSFFFDLEVIVLRTDQQLQHYWRDGAGWHEGPIIGSAA
jgi:Papain family cysteine protease